MGSEDLAENIVSYTILALGFFFSGLTVLLIAVNFRTMLGNIYARLMFIIQFFNFWVCFGGLPFFAQDLDNPNHTETDVSLCKAAGAIFYFCFLVKLKIYIGKLSIYGINDATHLR